jgi:hypothetical protein
VIGGNQIDPGLDVSEISLKQRRHVVVHAPIEAWIGFRFRRGGVTFPLRVRRAGA